MPELVKSLDGEEMDGADLPERPPARAVRREDHVTVVVSQVLGAGVGGPVGEDGVVGLEEGGGDGGGRSDDDVDVAEAETEERPVFTGEIR